MSALLWPPLGVAATLVLHCLPHKRLARAQTERRRLCRALERAGVRLHDERALLRRVEDRVGRVVERVGRLAGRGHAGRGHVLVVHGAPPCEAGLRVGFRACEARAASCESIC
ncbi:hypothetical protein T492DRAFT_1037667 [Pavlovales sp. CCMP2436]|nr:hypothetical protein T492DRAFT_1037667 [Pavlovales sp. CCMP2436]